MRSLGSLGTMTGATMMRPASRLPPGRCCPRLRHWPRRRGPSLGCGSGQEQERIEQGDELEGKVGCGRHVVDGAKEVRAEVGSHGRAGRPGEGSTPACCSGRPGHAATAIGTQARPWRALSHHSLTQDKVGCPTPNRATIACVWVGGLVCGWVDAIARPCPGVVGIVKAPPLPYMPPLRRSRRPLQAQSPRRGHESGARCSHSRAASLARGRWLSVRPPSAPEKEHGQHQGALARPRIRAHGRPSLPHNFFCARNSVLALAATQPQQISASWDGRFCRPCSDAGRDSGGHAAAQCHAV